MKKLLIILFLFYSVRSFAITYYVSATGSDANNGTSNLTPWQTIAKVNSTTLNPGDAVLFNQGDTFYGTLVISNSGSSGNPITYGSYGTGAQPIITGFTSITSWTSIGSGVYQNTCSSCSFYLNLVQFQDTTQPLGRWPKLTASNEGYLTINSHTGSTSLTSTDLSGALNYVGGDVVSRKNNFIMDKERITAQSGNTLTCNNTIYPSPISGSTYDFTDNYGFFIQNQINTLTQLGDWCYDSTHKYIQMYFGANSPSSYSINAVTLDYLVTINNSMNFITFNNITFSGSNSRTFNIGSCNHIQINNCNINFAGQDAIWVQNSASNNITVNNCSFNNTNNNAITANNSTNWTITNNTFQNTGIIRGAGINGDAQYQVMAYINSNSLIEYNDIFNSGFVAIHFQGDSVLVRNNYINGFNIIKRDGGAIYTYLDVSNTGRKVIGNIVLNGIGDRYGVDADLTNPYDQNCFGIYLDGGSRNVVIDSNTVANCSNGGFLFNYSQGVEMSNNTAFNNSVGQIVFQDYGNTFSGLSIKNNIFFCKESDQLGTILNIASNYISSFGTIDSNYYCRPILEPTGIDTAGYQFGSWSSYTQAHPYNAGGVFNTNIPGTKNFKSLDVWKTYSGVDAHSVKTPISISDTSQLKFVYNATQSAVTTPLSYKYMDAKGNIYNGAITLQPYTSAVLIQDGAINPPILEPGNSFSIFANKVYK